MRNKVTATICLVLMLGAAGCEVEAMPKFEIQRIGQDWKGGVEKVCVEGYAFLRSRVDRGGGMTQMWERDPVHGAIPMRCTKPPKEPQQNQAPDAANII